jgi:hypothetical protein
MGAPHASCQFALSHFLLPLPLLILLLRPFLFLLGSPSKYLDGLGEFIAHALLDFLRPVLPIRRPVETTYVSLGESVRLAPALLILPSRENGNIWQRRKSSVGLVPSRTHCVVRCGQSGRGVDR